MNINFLQTVRSKYSRDCETPVNCVVTVWPVEFRCTSVFIYFLQCSHFFRATVLKCFQLRRNAEIPVYSPELSFRGLILSAAAAAAVILSTQFVVSNVCESSTILPQIIESALSLYCDIAANQIQYNTCTSACFFVLPALLVGVSTTNPESIGV